MTSPTPEYREIPLTHEQVARVSPHRFEEINSFEWSARWSKNAGSYYAVRSSRPINGKRHTILMHRQILGLAYGDPREGDHVDPEDTLNNTDENLRIASVPEQQRNKGLTKSNTSGFKGVSWHKATGKWQAQIMAEMKKKYLGLFDTKELAHAAFCAAAAKYHGEFARTG
jgi:hypothetical protein